ncbi:toxin-antitoxin system YwqK family antitoxin [Flavisolibacter ginsengisoli]|uniref:MORN repeat variant n=1 Tax=Flavisolibacter ginsengisoli DSM 18119 TaxID=1121884 RepID=A0A1M4TEP9_9BACT|nr:hypothetical protein [Flavisolibacter ginsengisoli]SHE42868.1 hypothetical protein SAMN02745131_00431 [Flavisolibacter ginsengisoli DSM 18119]
MKLFISILFVILVGCSTTDMNNIEVRSDRLAYYKGTDKLVDGTVIRRFENGRIAERMNYKSGKQLGKWYTYDYDGNDFTHGVAIALNDRIIIAYRQFDLSKADFSINTEDTYKYASLELPSPAFKPGIQELLRLRTEIYNQYKDEYNFRDIYIHVGAEEYRFDKEIYSEVISSDTVKTNDGLMINVH